MKNEVFHLGPLWDQSVTTEGSLCDQSSFLCLGEQSFKHANVLSHKIKFSALGGPKFAIFAPGHPYF